MEHNKQESLIHGIVVAVERLQGVKLSSKAVVEPLKGQNNPHVGRCGQRRLTSRFTRECNDLGGLLSRIVRVYTGISQ